MAWVMAWVVMAWAAMAWAVMACPATAGAGPGLYGLGPWAYGPMLYNMGYSTYSNPFDFNSSIASARFVQSGGLHARRPGDVLRLFAADQYLGDASPAIGD